MPGSYPKLGIWTTKQEATTQSSVILVYNTSRSQRRSGKAARSTSRGGTAWSASTFKVDRCCVKTALVSTKTNASRASACVVGCFVAWSV
jgi:hypothetical protein